VITLQRWICVAAVILTGAVALSVAAQNANVPPPQQAGAPASDCRDEQGLTYICELVVPEDILTVGSTGLLLASGHRAPGHLYLIDPVTRTQSELIHGPGFARLPGAAESPGVRYARPESRRDVAPILQPLHH
jgi:hypothetical protein